MLTGNEPLLKRLWNAHKLTAEEEFYRYLSQNRVWPFIDLGNHYYYLVYRSNRLLLGLLIILGAIAAATYFFITSGVHSFTLCAFIICVILGCLVFAEKISKRELIINKNAGYLLRLAYTRNVLVEENIYNVYIRLQQKLDSSQTKHYYVIIGGYLLEDIRITRNTRNEQVMKVLGRYLAHNLGINYFDYHDETIKHEVYHFREQYLGEENDGDRDLGYVNTFKTETEDKEAQERLEERVTVDKGEDTLNQRKPSDRNKDTDTLQPTEDQRKTSDPMNSSVQTDDRRNSHQQADGRKKHHKRKSRKRGSSTDSNEGLQSEYQPQEETRKRLKRKGHHRKNSPQADDGTTVSNPPDMPRENLITRDQLKRKSKPTESPRKVSGESIESLKFERKSAEAYEERKRSKNSDKKDSIKDGENTNKRREGNPHERKRRRKRNSVAPQDNDTE